MTERMMGRIRRRVGRRFVSTTAAALVAALVLTGCSDDTDPAPEPTATTQAAPTPEEEVEAAYRQYWDVYAQLATSSDISPRAFDGVADGTFLESDIKGLRDQTAAGVFLTGSPEFTGFATEVDGDTATSLTCITYDSWRFMKDGEDITPDDIEPLQNEATLERRDGGWIVTDVSGRDDVECP